MIPTPDQIQAAIQYAVVSCGTQAQCREVSVSISHAEDGTVTVDARPTDARSRAAPDPAVA